MTLYNVHLYREMRLTFDGIEAATPEEAARMAADRLTEDAASIEDCDGENLAALVDVAGDDEYKHSVTIAFEAERLRKAAADMLDALHECLQELGRHNKNRAFWSPAEEKAPFAIAKATTVPTHQPERRTP